MSKSVIDMTRPQMLYASGFGLIMLVSLMASNVPIFEFSQYVDLPHRREICAGLFGVGGLLGAVTLYRHLARVRKPWKIPQSQVLIPYVGFFVTTLAAVILSR